LEIELEPELPAPTVDAGPDALLTCDEPEALLEAIVTTDDETALLHRWEPAALVSDPASPTASTSTPGIYTLTVVDTRTDCQSTDTVVVDDGLLAPSAEAGPDRNWSCDEPPVVLAGVASGGVDGTAYRYRWEPARYVSDPGVAQPTTTTPGRYVLTVTAVANGCTSADEVEVVAVPVALPTEPSAVDRDPLAPPLLVSHAADGSGRLRLRWEDQGGDDLQEVHVGHLPISVGPGLDHGPLECDVDSAEALLSSPEGSSYFLVVSRNCDDVRSSFGRSSFGFERPDSMMASGRACP
ncbi:MAG: hypothetical protein AAF533_28080, partial [Acidobacteriota bacterium]